MDPEERLLIARGALSRWEAVRSDTRRLLERDENAEHRRRLLIWNSRAGVFIADLRELVDLIERGYPL